MILRHQCRLGLVKSVSRDEGGSSSLFASLFVELLLHTANMREMCFLVEMNSRLLETRLNHALIAYLNFKQM